LKDFAIKLLDKSLIEVIDKLKWQSYSDLLFKYAEICDIYEEYEKMLKYLIKHFITEINPYTDNKIKNKIEISLNLRNKIIYSITKANIDYNSLIEIIKSSIDNIEIPKNFVNCDEIILLIEELFDQNTTLKDINIHLNNLYNIENVDLNKYTFNDRKEQEKVLNEIEKIISV